MTFTKKALVSSMAASVLAASALITTAHAEVSASVGLASTYLWRGYDLGSGTPAVSGDLSYERAGFYTGIWGSSGDTYSGSEYDLYAGYGRKFGENDLFLVDLSVWSYNYPTGPGPSAALDSGLDVRAMTPEARRAEFSTGIGDLTEVVLSLGAGPVAFTFYGNVAGDAGYRYYTLSGGVGPFSLLVGMHDNPEGDAPAHVNLDYAYSDNLAFTLSQFIADEPENDELKFVVSYSLPIGD